ncbi:MAG: MotA/TolQ/ExbB proton channel family protein [Planctomycetes bacterium]|nr:MotA/TolQ/ExbB proton channel family protein [Planctomycetota bacterium]
MFEIISKGGFFIWPLLVCSVISLAVIIDRFFALRRGRREFAAFVKEFIPTLEKKGIKESIEFCRKSRVPLARIYEKGLEDYQSRMDKERTKQIMQEIAGLELPSLERGLKILSVIAHISPLLGFLGTVTGMINAFQTIQSATASGEPAGPGMLAGGIWEALITTAVGLIVAIPTYIAFAYFSNVVDKMTNDMERHSREMLEKL